MNYDEFLGHVQHRARLASSGQAVAATRATLQTLAERLAGGAPEKLAAQLPRELQGYLVEGPDSGAGERIELDEFFRIVTLREGVDLPDAVFHARVVMEVLGQAISPGEMRKLRAQLPGEYDLLFESGSTGQLRDGGAVRDLDKAA